MSESGTGRGSSRVWFIVATVVIALLVVGSGALVSTLMGASASSEESAPQTSSPTPKRPLPGNQPGARLTGPDPQSCDDVYTDELRSRLDATGLPLNDPSVDGNVGAADEQLKAVIEDSHHLDCSWGSAGDYGLTTSITRVDAETSEKVLQRMSELGYQCHDESQGTRCVSSSWQQGTHIGESHFVRNGIWVATHWINFAPSGYTEGLIQQLWPDEAGTDEDTGDQGTDTPGTQDPETDGQNGDGVGADAAETAPAELSVA